MKQDMLLWNSGEWRVVVVIQTEQEGATPSTNLAITVLGQRYP